jgi:hypothetical protein
VARVIRTLRRRPRVGVALALIVAGALAVVVLAGGFTGRARGESDLAAAAAAAAPGSFVPSDGKARAVVWAVGDGADGGDDAKALAARIAAGSADRFLYLGDVYERGTAEEFAENYATVYGPLDSKTAPTPGNHDWPRHEQGYDPYWKRVYGKRPPAFYTFRTAGWQVVSLNSEIDHDADSKQVRWLEKTVRGPGTCRIAFWHQPRYSAGTRHGDETSVEPFWRALRGHARIIVNGHEHNMQRLGARRGMIQFVSGAGGKSHYGLDGDYPGVAFGNDEDDGALRLVLEPGRASFAFVATDGRTLDSGTIRCNPGSS